ncbi:hypothetical protein [Arthrobacter sp. 754]|uniref:LysM peptidoglycan-binding domain-containing protein n=1 Tax=Arthrobacter sp. 754 TaxID=3156315 RepID=UPI003394DE56
MDATTARGLRADAAMAASVLLLGLFLFLTGMGLMERWQQSAARRQGPDIDDLLGAVAVWAGLAIVGWWIVSVLLAAAAAVLAKYGRKRAAVKAGRFCPAFMRRLALAAFSVQLLSAPLAQAAVPPAGPAWVPTQEVAVQAQWAPTAASEAMLGPGITDTPDPASPTQQPAALPPVEPPTPAVRPEWRPSAPVPDPGLLAAQPIRAAQGLPAPPREITVLAGDTLWDIASRQLGPTATDVDVALQWPRWYEANKSQIGESPHVLLPGQILKSPSTA